MDHMDLEGREVTRALKGHRETVGLLEVLQAVGSPYKLSRKYHTVSH